VKSRDATEEEKNRKLSRDVYISGLETKFVSIFK